jgi:hypothetical protein
MQTEVKNNPFRETKNRHTAGVLQKSHSNRKDPEEILIYIVKCLNVTTHGFWADDRIYWTLRDYTLHFAITRAAVSTVTSLLLLLGSGFHQRMFPFL